MQGWVMDADIAGPSIPKMSVHIDKAYAEIVHLQVRAHQSCVMSLNLSKTASSVWRTRISRAKIQFLDRCCVGDLMMPAIDATRTGGDVTVFQSLPPMDLSADPQWARIYGGWKGCRKMAKMMNVPTSTVENMSTECPDNGKKYGSFGKSHVDSLRCTVGGLKVLAKP